MSASHVARTLWQRTPDPRQANQDDQQMPGTFLVIPYFAGDIGRPGSDRPLGTKAISYLCPSIEVNGVPGMNTFLRGAQTTVTVAVANHGAGTTVAPVQVAVWWSDPTTGFTKLNIFGQATVAVPTDGAPRKCLPITGVIPSTAPAHVCLLARVSCPFDAPAPGSPVAPADDRHWAQLNLNAIVAAAGQSFQFFFWAGNPFARPMSFKIMARSVQGNALGLLAGQMRLDLVRTQSVRLEIAGRRAAWNPRERDSSAEETLLLEAGERWPMTISGVMPDEIEPGGAIAIEVLQVEEDDREAQRPIGSIGVIVTAGRRA